MFNKPLQRKKYGRQHKLNYTSIPSAFSLTKKLNLLLKHRNCDGGGSTPSDMGGGGGGGAPPPPPGPVPGSCGVTSRVGHGWCGLRQTTLHLAKR